MAFEEPVETSTLPAVLLVVQAESGEERHPLRERETTIGRDLSNHICITNHFVSSFHAKIIRSGDTFSLVDLGSANKTCVNGRPIVQKAVNIGDEIHFAGVSCRLVDPEGAFGKDCVPIGLEPSTPPVSEGAQPGSESISARWKPPVSKLALSGGVLILFVTVAALATQVC